LRPPYNELSKYDYTIKSCIKKESQFNAKVRLNMQVKSIEDEINALKEAL
jgi:hypothetical protein